MLRQKKPGVRSNAHNNNNNSDRKYARYSVLEELHAYRKLYGKLRQQFYVCFFSLPNLYCAVFHAVAIEIRGSFLLFFCNRLDFY